MGPRPKDPLPMVVQGDFRKVGLHFSECFLNCLILKPQSQNEKISVFLFKLMCEGGKKVKKVRGLCKIFQNWIFLQHEGTMIAYFFSTFLKWKTQCPCRWILNKNSVESKPFLYPSTVTCIVKAFNKWMLNHVYSTLLKLIYFSFLLRLLLLYHFSGVISLH